MEASQRTICVFAECKSQVSSFYIRVIFHVRWFDRLTRTSVRSASIGVMHHSEPMWSFCRVAGGTTKGLLRRPDESGLLAMTHRAANATKRLLRRPRSQ